MLEICPLVARKTYQAKTRALLAIIQLEGEGDDKAFAIELSVYSTVLINVRCRAKRTWN